jgi:hypothetical protein
MGLYLGIRTATAVECTSSSTRRSTAPTTRCKWCAAAWDRVRSQPSRCSPSRWNRRSISGCIRSLLVMTFLCITLAFSQLIFDGLGRHMAMMSILLSSRNGLRLSNSSIVNIMLHRDMLVERRLRRVKGNLRPLRLLLEFSLDWNIHVEICDF